MNRTTLLASAIAAVALTASLCPPAGATSIYYAFTGVVDSNHSEFANLTTFSGLFSFDPLRPDTAPADPDNGYYPMANGGYGLSVDFAGGPSFLTDPMASYLLRVHVPLAAIVGQPPDSGRFTADGHVSNQTDRFLNLTFRKNFLTDALPGVDGLFGLADFDLAQFFYDGLPQIAPGPGEPPPPPYGIVGHLTSLICVDGCIDVANPNAIPEPGTMALLFAGLGMPGLLFRSRRRSPRSRIESRAPSVA